MNTIAEEACDILRMEADTRSHGFVFLDWMLVEGKIRGNPGGVRICLWDGDRAAGGGMTHGFVI